MIPHGKRHEVLFNKYLARISLLSAFFFNGKANICYIISAFRTSLVAQMVKDLLAMQETGFDPWVGKIPWRRKWQLTPVYIPGKFHGHRREPGGLQSMGSQIVRNN